MGRVDLSDLDGAFDDAPESTDGVPDGDYDVRVRHVEIRQTRNGNRILDWRLEILGPDCQGEELVKISVLRNDDTLTYLKRDLTKCGVLLSRLSELPERLEELRDLRLRVTARTKGQYQNVYVNECLRDDDGDDPPEEPLGSLPF